MYIYERCVYTRRFYMRAYRAAKLYFDYRDGLQFRLLIAEVLTFFIDISPARPLNGKQKQPLLQEVMLPGLESKKVGNLRSGTTHPLSINHRSLSLREK